MFFTPSLLILVTAFFCCNARIQKITSVDPNKSSTSTKRQADDTSSIFEQNLSLTSLNDKSSVIETENNGSSQKSVNSEGTFPPNILSEISMPLPLSPSTSIPNESQNLNGNSNFFETLSDSLKSLEEHQKISPPVVIFSKSEKLVNPVPENKTLFPDKFTMTIQNQDNLNKKNYADNSKYHEESLSSFQGGFNNDMKNPWNNVQVDPTNQNNNLELNHNQKSLGNPQKIITTTNKPMQSVVLLNLPKKTIYAEPGIDTPLIPSSVNSKRQVPKLPGLRAPKIGLLRKTTTIAPTTLDSSEIHQESSDPESSVQISLDSASNLVPANANLAGSGNLVPSVPSSLSKSKPVGGTVISLPIPSTDMTQQSQGTQSNEPVPCTCGVFLSGQFKRGSNAQPTGNSIITHEFDAPFACTTSGKNLCTNKCLDVLVKHLPNSGPIICGTVDDDIVREKAYLFVKNCRDMWVNTNLSSGKEHCCKNGEPIKCSTLPS